MEGIGRTRAFLTEFIIVILFFSLAAVTTLQLFLAASEKSHLSTEQTDAYLKLQMIAEEARGNGPYLDSLFSKANGWQDGIRYYDGDFALCGREEAVYAMTALLGRTRQEAGETVSVSLRMERLDSGLELGALEVCVYEPEWGEAS